MASNAFARIGIIWDKFLGGLFIFACLLASSSMIIIVYGVVQRYVIQSQPGWTIETTAYAIPYLAFLSAAWLLKKEKHIKMEFLLNALSPRSSALLNTINYSLCAIACFVIAYFGFISVWKLWETGTIVVAMLRVLKAPLITVIPVSLILFGTEFVRRAIWYFTRFRGPEQEEVISTRLDEVV